MSKKKWPTLTDIFFTDDEVDEIVLGLSMRRNVIETGNPVLSAADVKAGHTGKVKPLDADQIEKVASLNKLIDRISRIR